MTVSPVDDLIKSDVTAIVSTLSVAMGARLISPQVTGLSSPTTTISEPGFDDIYPDERYVLFITSGYGGDPQFPGQLFHRALTLTGLIRAAYASEYDAMVGSAAIAVEIEHTIPSIKSLVPDTRITWDVMLTNEINMVTSALLRDEPTTWIVDCRFDFMLRLVLMKNADGTIRNLTPV